MYASGRHHNAVHETLSPSPLRAYGASSRPCYLHMTGPGLQKLWPTIVACSPMQVWARQSEQQACCFHHTPGNQTHSFACCHEHLQCSSTRRSAGAVQLSRVQIPSFPTQHRLCPIADKFHAEFLPHIHNSLAIARAYDIEHSKLSNSCLSNAPLAKAANVMHERFHSKLFTQHLLHSSIHGLWHFTCCKTCNKTHASSKGH